MRAAARVVAALLLPLLVAAPALAQYTGRPRTPAGSLPAAPREPTPTDAEPRPSAPGLRLGALLPLSGPGAWFGKEIRQGIELAIAELNRAGRAAGSEARKEPGAVEAGKPGTAPEPPIDRSVPRLGVTLALEAADVAPLDVKRAADEFTRLAALGVPALFTATATPTLAIQPLAAARDVLVVHAGVVISQLATPSRTLLHARPPLAARVEALLDRVAEPKGRRLALVAGGDDFGKAVRAAVSRGWRDRGGRVVLEESVTLDAPDLPARLRQVGRLAPEAVVLGFQGADLGDVAARIRDAGYTGSLYLLDDDPAVRLAGASALEGVLVVSDAFVAEADSAGERFAQAYAKKFGDRPSRHAAQAYDSVMVLAGGLQAAAAAGRGTPGGARLREGLIAARSFPSIFGGRVAVRDDGTLVRPLALFTVESGRLAFVRHLPPPGLS